MCVDFIIEVDLKEQSAYLISLLRKTYEFLHFINASSKFTPVVRLCVSGGISYFVSLRLSVMLLLLFASLCSHFKALCADFA